MNRPNNRGNGSRRRPPKKNNSNQGQGQGPSQGQGSGKKKSNNRRRRPNNRNRNNSGQRRHHRRNTPRDNKSLTGFLVLKKHLNLIEAHNLARKKYFEFYHRANKQQLDKLERLFYQTLKALRDFEEGLTEEQIKVLQESGGYYPPDQAYSSRRDLTEKSYLDEYLANEEIQNTPSNIHVLESQAGRQSFADDDEESVGTIEDYYQMKGIEYVVEDDEDEEVQEEDEGARPPSS